MNIDNNNINQFLEKYINFVDEISLQNNYDENIKHLLFLIVPAFIMKYGSNYETTILDCFRNTHIILNDKESANVLAFFYRTLNYEQGKYYTDKYVVINNANKNNFTTLIDSLIHEFNHAVNSMINEIKEEETFVSIRSGLSYIVYDKKDLKNPLRITDTIVLEEVINTKQTEEIINKIISLNNYEIKNEEFNNFLYSLKGETSLEGFKSESYGYITFLCKELLSNKSFLTSIGTLKFKGFIDNIEEWFDSIAGKNGYKKLIKILNEILEMDKSLVNVKWFKKRKMNKMISLGKEAMIIVKEFNNNSVYK